MFKTHTRKSHSRAHVSCLLVVLLNFIFLFCFHCFDVGSRAAHRAPPPDSDSDLPYPTRTQIPVSRWQCVCSCWVKKLVPYFHKLFHTNDHVDFFFLNRCSLTVSVWFVRTELVLAFTGWMLFNIKSRWVCHVFGYGHVRKNLRNRGTCPVWRERFSLVLHTIPVCMCAAKE